MPQKRDLKNWKYRTDDVKRAALADVVLGGTSNIVVGDVRMRNDGRDLLMVKVDAAGKLWFNPEVHEDTHGRSYVYEIDGPVEQAAIENAKVVVLEISNRTPASSTVVEAVAHALLGKRLVLVFTGELGIDEPTCEKIVKILHGETVPDDEVKLRPYFPDLGFDLDDLDRLAELAATIGIDTSYMRVAIELRIKSDASAAMSARKLLLKTLRTLKAEGKVTSLTILSC